MTRKKVGPDTVAAKLVWVNRLLELWIEETKNEWTTTSRLTLLAETRRALVGNVTEGGGAKWARK